jgi:predicted nucleic acid-binding protein
VSLVLDCSVALAWCFRDEASEAGDALLDDLPELAPLVPALWHLEIGNVLLMAERRGRITSAQLQEHLALLRGLPLETDDEAPARTLPAVLALAGGHRLTAYDAAYLELAVRRGASLATRDSALARAARSVGVKLRQA